MTEYKMSDYEFIDDAYRSAARYGDGWQSAYDRLRIALASRDAEVEKLRAELAAARETNARLAEATASAIDWAKLTDEEVATLVYALEKERCAPTSPLPSGWPWWCSPWDGCSPTYTRWRTCWRWCRSGQPRAIDDGRSGRSVLPGHAHEEAAKHLRLTVTRYLAKRATVKDVVEAMAEFQRAIT